MMTWLSAPTAPGASGPWAAARSRPSMRTSRSARSSRSSAATGAALPTRMADHSRGSEAAMRVTSRSPWPASESAASGASTRREATSDAASCGTWETTATASSCSCGSRTTGRAPRSRASPRTAAVAAGSASSRVAMTHGRPAKRSASAAAAPDRSRPAIGWEPTYRPRCAASAPSETSAAMTALTLATSVTTASGWRSSSSTTTGPAMSGGVATTTSAGSGLSAATGSPAPMSRARARADGEVSDSSTRTPRPVSPRAMLVPSSPVPTTLTGPVVSGAAWLVTLVCPPARRAAPRGARDSLPPASQADARHERAQLGALDHPRGTGPERAEPDVAELRAHQPRHRVAHVLEHPPHDPVAALVQLDLHQRGRGQGLQHGEAVRAGRAVLQRDAAAQVLGQGAGHLPLDGGDVGLGDLVGGVGEAVGELAVVRQQQQPLGLLVQASDVEEPLGPVGDVLGQGGPPLRVAHGGDHAGRLVERHGELGLVQLQPYAVDVDDGGDRVHPGAQLTDDDAVDGHPPGGDEALAGAAGAVAGAGQDLLQPHALRLVHVVHRSSSSRSSRVSRSGR